MNTSSFSRTVGERPGKGRNHLEKNVSAKQRLQKPDTRVQGPHEHKGRTPDPETKKGQGKKASDRLKDQPNLCFPPSFRVRSRSDYLTIQRSGRKVRGRYLILLTIENNLRSSRFGITVSKKNGNAVKRNRVKRRIREIQRLNRQSFVSGNDVVMIARREAAQASFDEIEAEYLRLARLAGLMKKG